MCQIFELGASVKQMLLHLTENTVGCGLSNTRSEGSNGFARGCEPLRGVSVVPQLFLALLSD